MLPYRLATLIAGANAPRPLRSGQRTGAYNNFDSALAALETAIDAGLAHSAQMTQRPRRATRASACCGASAWAARSGGHHRPPQPQSPPGGAHGAPARLRSGSPGSKRRLRRTGTAGSGNAKSNPSVARSRSPWPTRPGMYSELLLATPVGAFRQVLATGADPGEQDAV